ncbi:MULTISPECIES: NusA-like transcription termination signal-binding factor [Acidilobus]|uniref:Probable transcription termination protein NusA n=1 Tax=Acidilobus saccharovorans (strain DSM 16705 / JCM 18335 / VKM B-2471 / 345-15) TaxID=666510 RepID=D9Q2P6_ACIS3|nr:NusA-like transcription termination signal-binding factor [Acidilobus saccharovorans]ADL19584.1 transcription elongation factor NusA-like protein [Acidilobus saccharovorans 345-15]
MAQSDANSKGDRIGLEELRFISLFQDITGAMVYRAIEDAEGNRIFYLVDKNDIGKAIGKDGRNVKTLSRILNKNVEVVEYSADLESMVRNLFPGVTVLKVDVVDKNDGKVVYVKVKDDEKGKAIGRDGRNVKRARIILTKLFNVDKVVIR